VSAPAAGKTILGDIDLRLAAPLMAQTVFMHVAVTLARIATSYKAVEIDLPIVWVGALSGAFSLLPALLAVPLGRIIDRGHDSAAVWVGSALVLVASIWFCVAPPSAPSLFLATALLGVGQLGCMAGHQMIAVRATRSRRGRDAVFGYHMVAIAAGQGLAPFAVAWQAGGARLPSTGPLFLVAFAAAVFAAGFGALLTPAPPLARDAAETPRVRVAELVGVPGLMAYVSASVITITGLDVIVVYLPLLGVERGIDAGAIGAMMTLRAVASMIARLLFVPLLDLMGRMPLTYFTMLSPALAFILIAAPLPVWAMYAMTVVLGVGLGVSATLTLSGIVDVAPPAARATAVSLRLSGNRAGLVVIPFLAGLVASSTGVGGVFVVVAALLAASTGGVWAATRRL
jgi:MFS family permease